MSAAGSKKSNRKRADELVTQVMGEPDEPEASDQGSDDDIAVPDFEDGPALLDEIERTVRRYVFLPDDHCYVALVLWVAVTHAIDHMEHATRLVFVSPEPQCGKTRALDIIEHLVWRPLPTTNATVAAITRSITKTGPPTLIIDEADTIFGTKKAAESNEDLRGILNSGHARGKFVLRWDMMNKKMERLVTFSPVVLAAIGLLPDTIMSRSIKVDMRRRPKDTPILPFRQRRDGQGVFKPLGARLAAVVGGIDWSDEEPDLPVEDRAADNWESLVRMADAIGGNWPQRARDAARALTASAQASDTSFGHEALADIRRVWEPGALAMHSEEVVERMRELEESPWRTYGGRSGQQAGLDQNKLSRLLHPYGIRTKQVKINGKNQRGYRLEDWPCSKSDKDCVPGGGLRRAWDSYLDSENGGEAPAGVGDDDAQTDDSPHSLL